MHHTRRVLSAGVGIGVVSLALLVTSCGGGGGQNSSYGGGTHPANTPTTARAAGTAAGGGAIGVSVKQFSVTPSKDTAGAGTVTFNVKNTGTIAHTFYVIKTDLLPAELPTKGNVVDETKVSLIDEIEADKLAAGSSATLTVDLTPGKYVLICNLPDHYSQGMHAAFTVQ